MYPMADPKSYQPEALRDIASRCSVRYRGYSYPCMIDGRCGSTHGTDTGVGACHTEGLLDMWWFWHDGQFVDVRAVSWDAGRTRGGGYVQEARVATQRHLDPIEMLFDMSEAFAFASRLAAATAAPYLVRISLDKMRDATLRIRTQGWFRLYGDYRSRSDCMVLEPAIVEPHSTLESYAAAALEKTMDVVGRFGMDREAPRCKLAREQGWFYARQLIARRGVPRGGLCSYGHP